MNIVEVNELEIIKVELAETQAQLKIVISELEYKRQECLALQQIINKLNLYIDFYRYQLSSLVNRLP